MSTTLPPASLPHADTVPPLHRFTVEEYLQLSRIGVVHADDNLELIEGVIVEKMTQNPPHASSITRLNRCLLSLLDDRWTIRVQTVLQLPDSLPEPILSSPPVQPIATTNDIRHPAKRRSSSRSPTSRSTMTAAPKVASTRAPALLITGS